MKIYKLSKGWAWFLYIFTPPLIALFAWMGVLPFLPDSDLQPGAAWFFVPLSVGMVLTFLYMFLESVRGRILLGEDKITQVTAFGARELRVDEVKEFAVNEKKITVFPLSKHKRKINISVYYAGTEEIVSWLAARVPDAEEVNREQEELALRQDEKYGFTEEERQAALHKAKQTNKYLSIAAGMAGCWVWIYPKPYSIAVCVCMAMPLLLLIVLRAHKGLIRLDTPKGSLYPNGSFVLIGPAFALILRAILDFNILDYGPIWLPTAVIGVVLAILLMVKEPGFSLQRLRSVGMVLLFSLFTGAYAFGSISILNAYFDHARREVFTATILDKKESQSKYSTTYYLHLTPWVNDKEQEKVDVPQSLYRTVKTGDAVQVVVMQGAFHIPWYYVQQ